MAKRKWNELSTEILQGKLRSARTIQATVVSIFLVIILAWIVLGYWKTNLPVFISTIAMGVAAPLSITAVTFGIANELKKRVP